MAEGMSFTISSLIGVRTRIKNFIEHVALNDVRVTFAEHLVEDLIIRNQVNDWNLTI